MSRNNKFSKVLWAEFINPEDHIFLFANEMYHKIKVNFYIICAITFLYYCASVYMHVESRDRFSHFT